MTCDVATLNAIAQTPHLLLLLLHRLLPHACSSTHVSVYPAVAAAYANAAAVVAAHDDDYACWACSPVTDATAFACIMSVMWDV